jgi:type IV secretory pathway VirB2 component (pilin)
MSSILQLFHFASTCSRPIGPGGPSLYPQSLCSGADVHIQALGDVFKVIGQVISILLYLAGGIAVVVVIIAGLYYIFSAGDPGRLKRAKDIISNAIIGVVVTFLAYGVVNFVVSNL